MNFQRGTDSLVKQESRGFTEGILPEAQFHSVHRLIKVDEFFRIFK